jgi:hypothetical protein
MARVVVVRTGTWWGELDAINANFADLYAQVSGPITQAEREIFSIYGDTVSVETKARSLAKFGRDDEIGTVFETVWEFGGDEVYATTNIIDTISSSDASDTAVVTLEGHTVTGTGTAAQFTEVTETVTLNGQNKVVLATPLARVNRASLTGSATVAGDVYVYADGTISAGVPTTAADVHITITGTNGNTQSYKAATAFSNLEYALLTGFTASVNKKTSASVDVELQIRGVGGVFRPVARISLNSGAQTTQQIVFNPYIIVPKNADVRIEGVASATGVSVDASFQAYLAGVV